ncbi:hypothetical protein D3P09_02465 [Paenibacillus pinisoli]|uniref:Uncharacterized protein n=1 Tax=Paenibacillus pinisoli TaxID=1276110 RepID=A0A3A6Q023_9BACL|nr:hypothetical protein D3P09_02465 [Paenibacillus pinisoli]
MIEPIFDEFGIQLCRSGISERIWAFFHSDPRQFKQEVTQYFELGYPGWLVVSANYQHRIIWLRDDRGRSM